MSEEPKEKAAAGEGKAQGGKKKLLLIAGLVVLLIGGGVGGFLFWKSGQSQGEKAAEKPKVEPKQPLQFLTLEPAFVVNFEASQAVRFLQIEVRLASRDLPTVELLKYNEPLIRNDLLMLFGNQNYQQVSTRDGKEKLRAETLKVVRNILKAEGGEPEKIEGVYFTSFVMQ